jgi:hypothetical protein
VRKKLSCGIAYTNKPLKSRERKIMLSDSTDHNWIRRTKWLTQALIISGTLNIGLISTFVYFVMKDKQEALKVELTAPVVATPSLTGTEVLHSYSLLPYQELLLRLENSDHVEEGLGKRDFSLACLVAFHHFNLDKALGGLPLQKRILPFSSRDGQEKIDIAVFPGLSEDQFHAILHYAKTEQWPLTCQGLFYELKRTFSPRDASLLDAFYLSSEYHAASTLLSKTGLTLTKEELIDLILEGEWKTLTDLAQQQRTAMDLTPDRRRLFLLSYLGHHSKIAAKLLLENDLEFISRRLDDGQVLNLLDLYSEKTPALEQFAKQLLASPRTDPVLKRAGALLYAFAGELTPEPYDHATALERFFPTPKVPTVKAKTESAAAPAVASKKKLHTIEPGDSLWKISRKYRVSVEEIMRVNHLDTEKLRVGKQLEIPEQVKK